MIDMMNEFSIFLTHEERYITLWLFENRHVRVADYDAALAWRNAFNRLLLGDDIDAFLSEQPKKGNDAVAVTLTTPSAHIIILTLFNAIKDQPHLGHELRTIINVIEKIKEHVAFELVSSKQTVGNE
jgi:hypothetical protein